MDWRDTEKNKSYTSIISYKWFLSHISNLVYYVYFSDRDLSNRLKNNSILTLLRYCGCQYPSLTPESAPPVHPSGTEVYWNSVSYKVYTVSLKTSLNYVEILLP